MPTLPLNRQPKTLATWDAGFYLNLWKCASKRASEAAQSGQGDCGAEYESANALYALHERSKKPAYPPQLGEGIGFYKSIGQQTPKWECLYLDTAEHIKNSIGDESNLASIPNYIDEAVTEESAGWRDTVCQYLQAVNDENLPYRYEVVSVSGDLNRHLTAVVFVLESAPCHYWSPFYIAVDGLLYDCTDRKLGDTCFLSDTLGWYVCDFSDEGIDYETIRQGYTAQANSQLRELLVGKSEPVWHWGLGCFVARLKDCENPVKLYPETPYYSG